MCVCGMCVCIVCECVTCTVHTKILSMCLHICLHYGMGHIGCGIRLVALDFHSYFVLSDKRKWGFEGRG